MDTSLVGPVPPCLSFFLTAPLDPKGEISWKLAITSQIRCVGVCATRPSDFHGSEGVLKFVSCWYWTALLNEALKTNTLSHVEHRFLSHRTYQRLRPHSADTLKEQSSNWYIIP